MIDQKFEFIAQAKKQYISWDSNARARVVNARTRDKTCACAFTTRARTFVH